MDALCRAEPEALLAWLLLGCQCQWMPGKQLMNEVQSSGC